MNMFTFEGQQVRCTIIDGEPWFVAADACRILGLATKGGRPNTTVACRKLDDDEKGLYPIQTLGGTQRLVCVSRPGLFALISRSNKPNAKRFQRWVNHEVLPQIMDNGGYMMAEHTRETARPDTKEAIPGMGCAALAGN